MDRKEWIMKKNEQDNHKGYLDHIREPDSSFLKEGTLIKNLLTPVKKQDSFDREQLEKEDIHTSISLRPSKKTEKLIDTVNNLLKREQKEPHSYQFSQKELKDIFFDYAEPVRKLLEEKGYDVQTNGIQMVSEPGNLLGSTKTVSRQDTEHLLENGYNIRKSFSKPSYEMNSGQGTCPKYNDLFLTIMYSEPGKNIGDQRIDDKTYSPTILTYTKVSDNIREEVYETVKKAHKSVVRKLEKDKDIYTEKIHTLYD